MDKRVREIEVSEIKSCILGTALVKIPILTLFAAESFLRLFGEIYCSARELTYIGIRSIRKADGGRDRPIKAI